MRRISILSFVLFGTFVVLLVLVFGLPVWSALPDSDRKAVLLPDTGYVRAEPFVLGFDNPWGMAFLPNGDILVTEIDGRIRVIREGRLLKKAISGVPRVYERGQGGLLDIVLHPEFSANRWLYLSYSAPAEGGKGGNTAIMRARLEGFELKEQRVLYRAIPDTTAAQHFGSRIAFDKKGYLYFSVGDRGRRDLNPQRLDLDGGKIYRLFDDGRVPPDNPFVDKKGAKAAIYSYGHRNPQGLALNPADGRIWSHEHGPRGGDEVNVIEAGKNYGWPVISYGINYSGTRFTDKTHQDGMAQPLTYWDPSIAPCGMTFISGERYPKWQGDLLVGSLKFNYLVLIELDGARVVKQEIVASDIGRVRNVAQGSDGYLYAAVQGTGLFRLVRAK